MRTVATIGYEGATVQGFLAALHEARIEMLVDVRAAARAGHHGEMHRIFREHLATPVAQADLETLVSIVKSGKHVCLMCFEADPKHCHRSIVADALAKRVKFKARNLFPVADDADQPPSATARKPTASA